MTRIDQMQESKTLTKCKSSEICDSKKCDSWQNDNICLLFSHENVFPKFLTLINYIFPSLFQLPQWKRLPMRQETRHYVPVWGSQWEGSGSTHEKSIFFSLGLGWDGMGWEMGILFFPLFSTCSRHVFMGFPKWFPKMFPISPHIYPLWFAQTSTIMWIN